MNLTSHDAIQDMVQAAAVTLKGTFYKSRRGVPVIEVAGCSIVYFAATDVWRVFQPYDNGYGDGQRRTTLPTLEDVRYFLDGTSYETVRTYPCEHSDEFVNCTRYAREPDALCRTHRDWIHIKESQDES